MDQYSIPLGLKLITTLNKSPISFQTNQAIVFILTFISYASYHVARKTTSVVKSSLDPKNTPGWAPFDGSNGSSLLGELDVAFLSTYAIGMYFSGYLCDRMGNRRWVVFVVGMIGSGVAGLVFGLGYWANIHSFYYFLAVQILAGLFQSTGWPFLIPLIGTWFGKTNRSGLIMGMWNATSPVGDVSGALIASAILGNYGWGWSFVFSGLLILFLAVSVFLFLPVSPESAGFDSQNSLQENCGYEEQHDVLLLRCDDEDHCEVKEELVALGFIEACKIPGVVQFALSLFFSKLVGYTFLYWLPFYISHTAIDGEYLSSEKAGYLSTFYDLGCTAGRILAGHISDRLKSRAFTSASCTYFAIPCLFLYRIYGHVSLPLNMSLMFVTGMFISGPFTIAATVSADLASTRGNSGYRNAASTVTGIINATGIVGAALGPLLTGYISAKSWDGVFVMLMVSALVSGLVLTRLAVADVAAMLTRH